MAATYRTDSIILAHRDDREVDRVLDILSPRYGHLTVRARGTKRITSKLAGMLEPMTHAILTLAVGRGHDIVMGSEVASTFSSMKADVDAVGILSLVNESLAALVPSGQPEQNLFESVEHLYGLVDSGLPIEKTGMLAAAVLFRLLHEVGLAPDLTACILDHRSLDGGPLALSYVHGGIVNRAHGHGPDGSLVHPSTVTLFRLAASKPLDELLNVRVPLLIVIEALERIVEGVEYHAERPIRSSVILHHLKTYAAGD